MPEASVREGGPVAGPPSGATRSPAVPVASRLSDVSNTVPIVRGAGQSGCGERDRVFDRPRISNFESRARHMHLEIVETFGTVHRSGPGRDKIQWLMKPRGRHTHLEPHHVRSR